MVTSPLPTSAELSVRVATPLTLTGWAQGAAATPGAAGARDGQRSETPGPGALALWNSMAAIRLAGAPVTVAESVMVPALSGTHMHGLLAQAAPLPTATPPTVAVMLVTVAAGGRVIFAVNCFSSKCDGFAPPPEPRLGWYSSS